MHDFITVNRDKIIARCRARAAARSLPPPSEAEMSRVPVFLDQLLEAVRSVKNGSQTGDEQGRELHGFTVSQVAREYGGLCHAVTELAMETDGPVTANDLFTLDRCLDDAVAEAVMREGDPRRRPRR
jgi:hypothetical protein